MEERVKQTAISNTFLYCSFHISLSKAFWWYLFYYLFFRTETYIICVNVIYATKNEISAGSDKRHDVTKVSDFTMGPMGKILISCRIQLKFRSWFFKKRWHKSWKFQFEKQVIKKLSPKSLWQTYMKWTVLIIYVVILFESFDFIFAIFKF